MKALKLPYRAPQGPLPEVAAAWLAREDEGRLGADGRAALEAWLAEDPRHRAAYAAAREVCEAAARHAADPQMMELRAAALAATPDRRTPVWRAAAGIAAGVVLLGGGWGTVTAITAPAESRIGAVAARFAPTLPPGAALYRTAVGERSTVVLPDGSVATLNTDSVLKVAYSGSERGVRLLRGQALFEVAKNKRVPFQVYAADRRITALGTVFDVRLVGERVKVALVEGVVKVSRVTPATTVAPAQQVTMTAGEVLEAPPAAAMVVKTADTGRATSWKDGVVVFDDQPLAEAVAEMNRYTNRHVVLADPKSGAYRVSGVFRTGDPERFADAMAEVFPLEVERRGDGSPELRPAGG
jgi:transmembrane sensor